MAMQNIFPVQWVLDYPDTRLSRLSIIQTVQMTVLLKYFDTVCFIRVVEQSSIYKSMGFTYPDYFTYPNIFVIELAHWCSDNGEPTVLASSS